MATLRHPWCSSPSAAIPSAIARSKPSSTPTPTTSAATACSASPRSIGQPHTSLPTRLPAQSATSLVLEIDPSAATGDLGSIEWSINDQAAAAVTLTRHGDLEPSDDARFAALVCTFAQWLAGDAAAIIDRDLLAALARETASTTLPADRADFLTLIEQALKL